MEPILINGIWYRLVYANEPDFPIGAPSVSALTPCDPQPVVKCIFCCDVRDSSDFDYCRCCGYGRKEVESICEPVVKNKDEVEVTLAKNLTIDGNNV